MPKRPRRAAPADARYRKYEPRVQTDEEKAANRAARDARNDERTAVHQRLQRLTNLARRLGAGADPDYSAHESFDIGIPKTIGDLGYSSTEITPKVEYNAYLPYLRDIESTLLFFLARQLHVQGGLSFQAAVYAELANDRGEVGIKRTFNSSNKAVINSSQLRLAVVNTLGELEDEMRQLHEQKQSGLSIHRLMEMVVRIRPYRPNQGPVVGGGVVQDHAIGRYLKLLPQLVAKQCTRNIIDKEPRCVANCIELSLYLARNPVAKWQPKKKPRTTDKHKPDRPSRSNEGRPLPAKDRVLDLSGLSCPIRSDELAILEERHNVAIHILTVASKADEILTLAHTRCSTNRSSDAHHIHLIETWSEDHSFSHCVLVKDLNALLNCESEQRYYAKYCPYCLIGFGGKKPHEKLSSHLLQGCAVNAQPSHAVWTLPEEGSSQSVLSFKLSHITAKFAQEYLIYATMQYAEKECRQWVGFSLRLVCTWDNSINTELTYVSDGVSYAGADIYDRYIESLLSLGTTATEHRKRPSLPLIMTAADYERKADQTDCSLCGLPLYGGHVEGMTGTAQLVHEHDHRTGKFRGMAHAPCNLFYTDVRKRNERGTAYSWSAIPVICNDLSPIHPLIFGRSVERKIHGRAIVRGTNDWISYSIGNLNTGILQTISSTSFLGENKQKVSNVSPDPPLLGSATLFDREWVVNRLSEANLAQMQQFEAYRAATFRQLGFDAARFITVNKLAWSYMLSTAPIERCIVNNRTQTRHGRIELLDSRHQDIQEWMLREYPCRGGICIAPGRQADAKDGLIVAFDFTRFYPGELKRAKLPVGDYRWAEQRLYDTAVLAVQPCDGDTGYAVTFAGHYPPDCHDRLRFLAPLAHYEQVDEAELSDHQRAVLAGHGIHHRARKQLMLTLLPKERYTCSLSLLQLAMRLGLVVTKVIKVLQFRQANSFRAPGVDVLHQRIIGGEDHLKPVSNAVYGQTCERKDRYTSSTVVTSKDELIKQTRLVSQYVGETPLSDKHLLVRKTRRGVLMDVPMLQAAVLLDKSKERLLQMFYDVLMPTFGDALELLYTDTDSLLCQFKGYDQAAWRAQLDQNSHLWQGTLDGNDAIVFEGKGAPSTLKVEGYPLHYVGLHQKCYTTVYDKEEKVKAAGVPQRAQLVVGDGKKPQPQPMSYRLMRSALEKGTQATASYTRTGVRKDGTWGAIDVQRQAFVAFDGSRWDDGERTLPFGHCATAPRSPL